VPELPPELLLLPQPWIFEEELLLVPELLPELVPQPWMFWLPDEEPEDDDEEP
jgi:hypothetical protein